MADRRTPNPQSTQDHDLLIELRTEMRGVREDIQKLTDGTAKRLADLEGDHVTREEKGDLETRLRFVEKYVWGAIAIIGLLNLIGFGYIITHLH
jgi:hypothetical protein